MHVPAVEEPDSLTAVSVPEKRRSTTPELQSRRVSFGGGSDSEPCKTVSPASCLPDNMAEQVTVPSVSPSRISAADQLNTSSDHAIEPAVASVHNESDSVHVCLLYTSDAADE